MLGPREVAYPDLTGSGIETLSHLRENGRICFMFCAFEGRPRIVRLHARGEAIEPGEPRWDELAGLFADDRGQRAIIRADVTRIADSCGWGVPLYRYEGQRDQLVRFAEQLGPEKIAAAQSQMTSRVSTACRVCASSDARAITARRRGPSRASTSQSGAIKRDALSLAPLRQIPDSAARAERRAPRRRRAARRARRRRQPAAKLVPLPKAKESPGTLDRISTPGERSPPMPRLLRA